MVASHHPTHTDAELAELAAFQAQVGHVVIMVSAKEQIVVGSHGRESTPEGARRGAGYRRLLDGREHWSQGRVLRATYRIRPDAALVNPGRR